MNFIVIDVRRPDVNRDQITDVIRALVAAVNNSIIVTPPGIDIKTLNVEGNFDDDLPAILVKKEDEVFRIVIEDTQPPEGTEDGTETGTVRDL